MSAVSFRGRFEGVGVSTQWMMSASSIGAGRGGGYARYLEGKTVAPERGDYYLTPGGELAEAPGNWLSAPDTLARLGVDPDAPVDGGDFIALMEGRHPGTGRWLRRAGADGSRGGGIDVTFSAPKSVSVVWALGDPWQREQIEAAHARAVERSVGYLRERVPVVRRRYGAEVIEEPAKDLIAAAYRHTTARGVSGADAPDPQLHTHVVISGAVREDGRIVAVASRPVFRGAREVGAFYRSALAEDSRGRAIRSSRAPAATDATSRSQGSPRSCVTRSPAATARSHRQRSGSVPSTAALPNAGSCVTWRSRTAAPRTHNPRGPAACLGANW